MTHFILPGQSAASAQALRFLVTSNRNTSSSLSKRRDYFCLYTLLNCRMSWMEWVLRTFGTRDLNVALYLRLLHSLSPPFVCICLLLLASFFSYCRWASCTWKIVSWSVSIYRCLYSLWAGRKQDPYPLV